MDPALLAKRRSSLRACPRRCDVAAIVLLALGAILGCNKSEAIDLPSTGGSTGSGGATTTGGLIGSGGGAASTGGVTSIGGTQPLAVVTIASGQCDPVRIAVDATNVYWTNYGSGTVMKVPLAGGVATTLASGMTGPLGIVVDATSVYWSTRDHLLFLRLLAPS